MAKKLTVLQERFVHEFLVDLNATAACLRAGYRGSETSLGKQGYDNLRKPKIALNIARKIRPQLVKADKKAEDVIKQLCNIAFADIRDYLSFDEKGGLQIKDSALWTTEQAAAVTEISERNGKHGRTLTFKLASKTTALEMLARYHKLLLPDPPPKRTEEERSFAIDGMTVEELIILRKTIIGGNGHRKRIASKVKPGGNGNGDGNNGEEDHT